MFERMGKIYDTNPTFCSFPVLGNRLPRGWITGFNSNSVPDLDGTEFKVGEVK